MNKFYLIALMAFCSLFLTACYSDNDEPMVPQEEEQQLTETMLNEQMSGKIYERINVVPLEGSGDNWTEKDIAYPAIYTVYDFLLTYVNQYFWSRNGKMYVDFCYKSTTLREMFGDDFLDFNNYMAENNNFSYPYFVATGLKYNALTHELSTTNYAFDREEVPGMRFVLESFQNDVLVIRTEYNEPYNGITAHRTYYKATTKTPETFRDFESKTEFMAFFDYITSLWKKSRGKE